MSLNTTVDEEGDLVLNSEWGASEEISGWG